MKKVVLAVAVVMLMVLVVNAGAAILYDVIRLPQGFMAQDLNNAGWVCGSFRGQAAVWIRGKVIPIRNALYPNITALRINDRGTVLAASFQDGQVRFLLVDQFGRMVQRVEVPGSFEAVDLNDYRVVVGQTNNGQSQRGVLWANGEIVYLTTPEQGFCTMVGITDNGELTGFLWGNGAGDVPFLINGGFAPLQLLPGNEGRPTAINNSSQVVGFLNEISRLNSSRWIAWGQSGRWWLISADGGKALDINDRSDILAWFDGEIPEVVVRKANGETISLDVSLSRPLHVLADFGKINNNGEVLCSGIEPTGQNGYYLLRPRR